MENPTTTDRDTEADRSPTQRSSLKSRHASALAKLMIERQDLRGTYAFADFIDDSLRCSALSANRPLGGHTVSRTAGPSRTGPAVRLLLSAGA